MGTGFRYGGACCRDSFSLAERDKRDTAMGSLSIHKIKQQRKDAIRMFFPCCRNSAGLGKKRHEQG